MPGVTDTLSVENVVASTGIDQELNLEVLAQDLNGSSYNPDHFPGLIYRIADLHATALIFRTGKIVCTGANSVSGATTAIDVTFDTLDELGIDIPESPEIEIQNMVVGGDLNQDLNLNALAIGLGLEHVEYEPEQFPGLVYRQDNTDVVILLFGSGKVVITGATELGDAEAVIENLQKDVDELGLLQ